MKKAIKNNRLLIFGALMLGVLFYWLYFRPARIKSHCDWVAWGEAEFKAYDSYWKTWNTKFDKERYEWKYSQCLHSKGLN